MTIMMTRDGQVRPLEPADLQEVAERDRRIAALENQCATLAAQVDRQAKVVDAAQRWARNDKGFLRIHLRTAVINYEHEMAQLAKGAVKGDGDNR